MTETAQQWLDRMADTWLTNPDVTPSFPPGLVIRETGWRVRLEVGKLTAANAYDAVRSAEDVEFYAVLGDGTEVTAIRPLASMTRATVPAWQRRERACCCGRGPMTATCRHCGGEIVSCADAIPYCQGWKHAAFLHYGPVGPHYCGGRSVNPVAEPREERMSPCPTG